MRLATYISRLEAVLPRHFAPDGLYHGKEGALRLAREVGVGLADSPDAEVKREFGSLFSRLLVRFTFNTRGGVPIGAKEFNREMKRAWEREKQARIERKEAKCQ